MANTYVKIASVTVTGATAANMEFTSIPATYDDLLLRISHRSDRTGGVISASLLMAFNASSANFSGRRLQGNGSAASSASQSTNYFSNTTTASSTANIFTSTDIYIPNYRVSANKTFSVDDTHENTTVEAYAYLWAGLWSQTTAINQITLTIDGWNFVTHSTATLYGIKKS